MRIRKHAQPSSLMFSDSNLKTETVFQSHICQLNQSRWDVMVFSPSDPETPLPPPSPYQVRGDNIFGGNGCLEVSLGAVERGSSMKKIVEEGVDVKLVYSNDENGDERESLQLGFNKGETVLCCKTDGKSWRCKKEAKNGHSLCEHHLNQVLNYTNLAHTPAKKIEKENLRRARANRKASSSSSSNPNEFYYYSGFGPCWGKKRGVRRNEKAKRTEPVVVEPIASALASSQINDEEFHDIEDEDDEREENGEAKRKRVRKPIKARSLKSLM